MTDLNTMTIADARNNLRAGEINSEELTEACLTAIEGAGALGAFVHHTPEIAREQAKAADARLQAGDAPSMCGIPLGIKDLFCTKGVPSQPPAASSTGSSRNTNPPSARTSLTRAPSCWASSTWTSSPWARRTKPVFTATP